MRVLILNRFYWPDEIATAQLTTDLAEDLAARGHSVMVATSRLSSRDHTVCWPARETRRGVHIRRLWSTRFGQRRLWLRAADLLTFQASLYTLGTELPPCDVILSRTDPPLLACAAAWIARWRGGKLAHLVDDLHPDIDVALGILNTRSRLVGVLKRLMGLALRQCEIVFALGPVMAQQLCMRYEVEPGKMVVTPPWSDGALLRPLPSGHSPFRAEWGLPPSAKVLMYSGNFGRGHRFDTLIAGLARVLPHLPDWHVLFVGGGVRHPEVCALVDRHQLPRTQFQPHQPRERLGDLLTLADAHLITQDPDTVGLIVPSKISGVLAVGRPALYVGPLDADAAVILRNTQSGIVVGPDDVDGVADAMARLAASIDWRQQCGIAARAAFERDFDRSVVVSRIEDHLSRIVTTPAYAL